MADPVVHITNGIPDLGTGNITTLGQTLLDGANLTLGAVADAAASGAGTINAHLRSIATSVAGTLTITGTVATSGTSTISGTVTANQGGAPWTMRPDGTLWTLTGTSANVNITNSSLNTNASQSGTWNITNITGTVSLPTGAATSAKQPALGTAGAASADVITVQGITAMTPLKVDGSGVTQPVSGTVTANQGGTWTVQPGNTANTTAWKVDGSAVTQPVSVAGSVTTISTLTATSGNTFTYSRVVAAASTNATSLKASSGSLSSIDVFNVATYAVYLKLYNKASAPTVGSDTPVWTIPLPAGGGFSRPFNQGEFFSVGIAYAITKLVADTDTTAVAAGDVTGRIKWI